jgi:ectoine hydroxylase-related dioxygenase (phytanoyl-CoA dioxygenase family)
MHITQEHLQFWREHGYVIVDSFLSHEELRQARANMERYVPTWEEFCAAPERYPRIRSSGMVKAEFPFVGTALNDVTTHHDVTDAVERLLGTRQLHLTQSIFWAKFARTHDYEQELHLDYQNNTLVFPSDDERFQQVPMILYYDDVAEGDGPTYVVSRKYTDHLLHEVSHARDQVDERSLATFERLNVPSLDPSQFASVYEHEQPVIAKAGSLLVFTMSTFHRGSAICAASGRRLSHHIVYRAAGREWMGWLAWPRRGADPEMRDFVQRATPRQLELLGFPAAGHEYWTASTLAGVAARYPRMDMTPYREALERREPAVAGVIREG